MRLSWDASMPGRLSSVVFPGFVCAKLEARVT
jgi:hypothetical protein